MSKNPVPELTTDQRRDGLAKAMRIRAERAILKKDLKLGLITVEQVLKLADSGMPSAARLRVNHLIASMPGYGKAKAARLMSELNIAEGRRVEGLGKRQRDALVKHFEEEALK